VDEPKLGPLEMRVMKEVWRNGRATVHDVRDALGAKGTSLAYTTVLTTLRALEGKGLVGHDLSGRSHVYFAIVAEGAMARSVLQDVLHRLFDGSKVRLVHALLDDRDLSRREFEALRKQVLRVREKEEEHG
jgi:BlaI family transcriptional regulator, penicillinase repressor